MSEKLCLQWNNFKENIKEVFENFREDENCNDVTLACEDGQQVEARKVIKSIVGRQSGMSSPKLSTSLHN